MNPLLKGILATLALLGGTMATCTAHHELVVKNQKAGLRSLLYAAISFSTAALLLS